MYLCNNMINKKINVKILIRLIAYLILNKMVKIGYNIFKRHLINIYLNI
jgi:hypothetical protein